MALCKIQIIGNLGRDPEMKYTPSGKPVTSFTVAVNQSRKDQQTGEWTDETDWFRVTVWGERGEHLAETLKKGAKVFVGGRFKTRQWQDNEGVTKTSLEITGDDVYDLRPKAQGEESHSAPAPASRDRAADDDIDELPF